MEAATNRPTTREPRASASFITPSGNHPPFEDNPGDREEGLHGLLSFPNPAPSYTEADGNLDYPPATLECLEHHLDELDAFCRALGLPPLDEVEPRRPVRVGGEVRSVRIVPRAGADALEVTVSDGRGAVTAVFLGRRKILGISPGRRIALEGVVAREGSQQLIYNPLYTLL